MMRDGQWNMIIEDTMMNELRRENRRSLLTNEYKI
jgi:hypothetical protein